MLEKIFGNFATKVSEWSGKPATFTLAVALVVVWAVSGPLFGFSEIWQLVINTGTTIVTFLMVFLLQNSQNRDSRAVQAKLDELILTSQAANRFIGIEKLNEKEILSLSRRLAEFAKQADDASEDSASELPDDQD